MPEAADSFNPCFNGFMDKDKDPHSVIEHVAKFQPLF